MPQSNVSDWWSRATVAYLAGRLRGADVPTKVRLTFTAPYHPPTGP